MPRMPLSGVRISWLTVARKRDFASLAASARSRAAAAAFSSQTSSRSRSHSCSTCARASPSSMRGARRRPTKTPAQEARRTGRRSRRQNCFDHRPVRRAGLGAAASMADHGELNALPSADAAPPTLRPPRAPAGRARCDRRALRPDAGGAPPVEPSRSAMRARELAARDDSRAPKGAKRSAASRTSACAPGSGAAISSIDARRRGRIGARRRQARSRRSARPASRARGGDAAATSAEPSAGGGRMRSAAETAGTSICTSMRSSSGPDRRA